MTKGSSYIILILSILIGHKTVCQTDTEPPAPPVLNLVSVNPVNGWTNLEWTKSPSPDVAGYVIYFYINGEGFAIDTIFDPEEVSYSNSRSAARLRIESYVVAAIDTAGNISPLSNDLNTILLEAETDTCRKKILLSWNSYKPTPSAVQRYAVYLSENSGAFNLKGMTLPGLTEFTIDTFTVGSTYCYIVKAELAGGAQSSSPAPCSLIMMQRPPAWINADYASVNDENQPELSFTFDPLSEIRIFRLERKRITDPDYSTLTQLTASGSSLTFTDISAEAGVKYGYRLAAVNNCGNPVVWSNECANILLVISQVDDNIELRWNKYRSWDGGVGSYRILVNTGSGFTERVLLGPADSAWSISYSGIMYDLSQAEVCFKVSARENINRFGIAGASSSNVACIDAIERIYVPNAFTPDNDLINDHFRPVMSFTPVSYRLVITDRSNRIIFESENHMDEWDGTYRGSPLPGDVYLWYLRVTPPSGKAISRTGTVSIIKSR